MTSNGDIVTAAFDSWKDVTGYVASIFADDMTEKSPAGPPYPESTPAPR